MNFLTPFALFLAAVPCMGLAQNLGNVAIVGKNQWLFYGVEFSEPSSAEKAAESLALIAGLNGQLKDNGVSMQLAVVPIKARIVKQQLPDERPLSAFLETSYPRMLDVLRAKGVSAADINAAFMSGVPAADAALFYRLDSHWSQRGAFLAAETVKKEIESNSDLKALVAELPSLAMTLVEQKKARPSKARNLTQLLPEEERAKFGSELLAPLQFQRGASTATLTGAEAVPRIVLVGSSFSQEWTGFADSLRYYLQREVGNYSLDAAIGQWVALYRYLQSDAFQTTAPKLLIWEIPEPAMAAPPDYKFREDRYRMHPTDWTLGATAWVQRNCKAGAGTVKGVSASVKDAKASGVGGIKVSNAAADASVEFDVANASKGADYLDARLTSATDQTLSIEVSAGKKVKLPSLALAGDGQPHVIRIPLTSSEGVVTKAKITLSAASANFEVAGLRVCQHKPTGL